MEVFIVVGCVDYENSRVLLGFTERAKAETAVTNLKEHGWDLDRNKISTEPLSVPNRLPTTLDQTVYDHYEIVPLTLDKD